MHKLTKAKNWYYSLTESGKKRLKYYYGNRPIKTDEDIIEFYEFCSYPGNIITPHTL